LLKIKKSIRALASVKDCAEHTGLKSREIQHALPGAHLTGTSGKRAERTLTTEATARACGTLAVRSHNP
jgi:hypothetical protein